MLKKMITEVFVKIKQRNAILSKNYLLYDSSRKGDYTVHRNKHTVINKRTLNISGEKFDCNVSVIYFVDFFNEFKNSPK